MPTEGLKIIVVPGSGYYGYAVTRVGWLKRVAGDEYVLIDARTVVRTGQYSIEGLNKLAAEGPGKKYKLSEPDSHQLPEELHRLTWKRCLPCDEEAWKKHCPRPEGWPAEAEAA